MSRRVEESPGDVVERPSSLCDRYNGFVLGQCLSLAFTAAGRPRYAERRARVAACLAALDVGASVSGLPETPPDPGGLSHAALLTRLLPRLALHSRELAEFVVLGGLLLQYGLLAADEPDFAASLLVEVERLRRHYDLPPLDGARLIVPPDQRDGGAVLAPSLAYLRAIVRRLPLEPDTALVRMPFTAPYAEDYLAFARPALDACGFRTLRDWGRLPGEDDGEVGLAVIGRCGFVWADVSEAGPDDFLAIGAAQALGRRGVLVVRADRAGAVPAFIGRDAVIRYDPADADWPGGAVPLMAACLAALELAAERGERLRVTPDSIAHVFDEVSHGLRHVLLPAALEAAEAAVAEAGDPKTPVPPR